MDLARRSALVSEGLFGRGLDAGETEEAGGDVGEMSAFAESGS